MLPSQNKVMVQIAAILLALFALAACSQNKSTPTPTPLPPTPTIPAVITRIVTPGPTDTPAPTPTLTYNIQDAAGRWIVRFDLVIKRGSFAQEIDYNGFADLQVKLDGTITGTGHFSQNLSNPPCTASVLDEGAISFTVKGTTFVQGEQIAAQIDLIPNDPGQIENYALICPDFNDVRHFSQPLLWPALMALQRHDAGSGAAVTGLHWSFALQNTPSLHFEADLNQETGGQIAGYLVGDVSVISG